MSFEPDIVAAQYGPAAADYAEAFFDNLETNDFDRRVVASVLEGARAGGLVLDAGCGPGQGAAFAQARGFTAIGIDVTPEMLEAARGRTGVPVVRADIRFLPFAAATFHAVIAWYSLLHVPRPAMLDTLRGLRRVLRVGAPLIVGLHGGRGDVTEESGVSWCQYEAHDLARLLRAAGFGNVVARTRPPLPHELQVTTKLVASAIR